MDARGYTLGVYTLMELNEVLTRDERSAKLQRKIPNVYPVSTRKY